MPPQASLVLLMAKVRTIILFNCVIDPFLISMLASLMMILCNPCAHAVFKAVNGNTGFSGHCRGVAASVPSLPASQSAPYPQKLQCSKSVSGWNMRKCDNAVSEIS